MVVKNKNTHKYRLVGVVILTALLVAGGLWFNKINNRVATSTPMNGPTPEQKQAQAEVDADNKQKLIEGNKPTGPTSTTPTNTPTTTLDLSAQQELNGSVTVFTKLFNISNGACNLVIDNGVKQVTQSAGIIYQSEYSSCAGFSVPVSALGSGNWSLALTVTSNSQTFSKTITYEVK